MVDYSLALRSEYVALGAGVVVLYVLSGYLLRRVQRPLQKPQETSAAVSLRRAYVAAFGLGLAAEYVCASQVYALLRVQLGLGAVRIAEVYAVAFAASWASALLVVPRCERALGKRGACVACLCLYGAGALLCGRGASYEAALLGRALAGAAQPLLEVSFDAYQRAAHTALELSTASRMETYALLGTCSSVVSVGAGVLAECLRVSTRSCLAAFDVSAALAALGLVVLVASWPAAPDIKSPTLQDHQCGPLALLETVGLTAGALTVVSTAACFEAAQQVATAAWAPALALAGGVDAPFGLVFSMLMACAVSGTRCFQLAAMRGASFERVALALCLVAAAAFGAFCLWPSASLASVAPLLVFQLCVGCSLPTFASLKGKYVPTDARAATSRATSWLVGALAFGGLLLLPLHSRLVFATLAALLLASTVALCCAR